MRRAETTERWPRTRPSAPTHAPVDCLSVMSSSCTSGSFAQWYPTSPTMVTAFAHTRAHRDGDPGHRETITRAAHTHNNNNHDASATACATRAGSGVRLRWQGPGLSRPGRMQPPRAGVHAIATVVTTRPGALYGGDCVHVVHARRPSVAPPHRHHAARDPHVPGR